VYLLESSGAELKVLDERVAQIREIVQSSTCGELPLRILHLLNELSLMRETLGRNEGDTQSQ
jgi:hypothetical protein